jgi:hypothetical protein
MPRRLCLLAAVLASQSLAAPVETVIIIGVDGLSPRGVDEGTTPNLNRLIESGSHTFHARGVFPTSSSPNWASMIMGAGPEQHGITSNDWRVWNAAIRPSEEGPKDRFPDIFSELRRQRPDARIAVLYDWGGFGELFDHAVADVALDTEGPEETMAKAIEEFRTNRPDMLFVHLDHVDGAGHGEGWHTPPYFDAVQRADSRIGEMMQAVTDANAWASTVLIVTSDHGGTGRSHGGLTMAELEIPWIISGAGIAPAREITRDVNTFDTACTAAALLGIQAHPAWIGRPVAEAMESGTPDTGWRESRYLPAPRISPPGALIVADRVEIALACEAPDAVITYTTDGSEPTPKSTRYTAPFPIAATTTVRARSFRAGVASRETVDAYRLLRTDSPRPVHYAYFEAPADLKEPWKQLPSLTGMTPVREGFAPEIGLATIDRREDQFAIRFTTQIRIPTNGTYTLNLRSDDGSRLFVGRRKIIDNDGSHGPVEVSGSIDLTYGLHTIVVEYFDDHGGELLELTMTGTDNVRVPVSFDQLEAPEHP